MTRAARAPARLGWKRRLAADLVRRLIAMLGWTYRTRFVVGGEVLERIVAGEHPVIFCMWHDGIVFFPPFLRDVQRRGVPLTVFTSLSRDGELVAQLALAWGAEVVRGSSSRGGIEALRKLVRAVRAAGRSPVVIPDGPRGPRRKAKPGAMVLARMSGIACVPMACAARGSRLPTWDRLLLPRPFTKVAVAVGDPLMVARDSDPEAERLRLEQTLNALTAQAEAALTGGFQED